VQDVQLQIHGWTRQAIDAPSLGVYGADAPAIAELAAAEPAWREKDPRGLPYIRADGGWAVLERWARNVRDVFTATRALFFVRASKH